MKTPLMQKYEECKRQNQDAVILVRLGDFYEAFGEDARTIASILDLTLTSRRIDGNERISMCGFPFHVFKKFSAVLSENNIQVKVVNEDEVV